MRIVARLAWTRGCGRSRPEGDNSTAISKLPTRTIGPRRLAGTLVDVTDVREGIGYVAFGRACRGALRAAGSGPQAGCALDLNPAAHRKWADHSKNK